jgi:eukaryotic-like serine/threonine-protein kinase
MKSKLIFLTIILFSLILTACAGGGASAASSWPGLGADAENAYVAFNQHVYAVNLSNGLEKWRFPVEGKAQNTYYAAPAFTPDGQLLVGDYSKILHSLNPQNGQENWSFSDAPDRYVGSPLTSAERIFAPNAGSELYSLDMKGNLVWSFATGGPLWATPTTDPNCECIYLPSMDHHLYAVNAQTGNQEWVSEDFGGSIVGAAALSEDGVLYVGTFASEILAVNSEDGSVIWRKTTNEWVWGGPQLKDGVLYFGDLGGTLYAMDAKTGEYKWQVPLEGDITEPPLVTDDAVYVANENGSLNAIDLNGNKLWNKQFNGKLYTSPVKSGDLILVAQTGGDELLFALDANGNQKWAFIPEKK